MLIGVAGFAGAGKTTAVEHLSTLHDSEPVYLGQVVLDELQRRGLPQNSENEQLVRKELRTAGGPAALALRRVTDVSQAASAGRNVLIDAIYNIAEFEVLRACVGDTAAVLLAVHASIETRQLRLAKRLRRPLSAEELKSREAYEREQLRTDRVFNEAGAIENEGTLDQFRSELTRFFHGVRGVRPQ